MAEAHLSYEQIDETVLRTLGGVRRGYAGLTVAMALLAGIGGLAWGYMILVGMQVTGLTNPVFWAVFIVNFVFWIGIGHAGTLISAFLYILRVPWRNSIYRAAETMTVFAVATAGLFPLVHLGRVWVAYYIMPIPNTAHLWPNFKSPLAWDVLAITTYLVTSVLFWYLGLLPDLATVRDRATGFRFQLYRVLALGWHNRWEQWRHYARAYLALACLAAPLVLSVHTVVSFDFAMALIPGWHSTIFAPFFVVGAIHSGLAMVLVLLIPLRRHLQLEQVVTERSFEGVAQLLIFTAGFMFYSYFMEAFIAWYTGDPHERGLALWRAVSTPYAPCYWMMVVFNGLIPFLFAFKKVRTSHAWQWGISFLVIIGMWLERFVIIVPSLAHSFLPSSWRLYNPRPVEVLITLGSFGFFLFLYLAANRVIPAVAISELKEGDIHHRLEAAL